jgi:serine/threonine protein kinase
MTQGIGPGESAAPVVAGYRVESLVGAGGCGEVWRARDVLTGRLVALKRLRHDGPPAERDRLRREAAVLAGLSSPHIVRLITVVTSAQGLVLVLEFQGGGSLASLLRVRPRLAAGEVVTIAAPIAAALAEVHAAGLVHGDVSPANLLFATDGRPMLSDLGVARMSGHGGADAVTAAYTDPAVLDGGPLTPTTDVYGLAAVCFQALTGQPPFHGDDVDAVRAAAALPRPGLRDVVPGLPEGLAAVIEDGLSADLGRRPGASAFAARLLESCPALPVRLAGASVPVATPPTAAVRRLPAPPPAVEPQPSRLERVAAALARVRLTPRRLVAAAAVPTALAGAIWGGVAWARSSSPSAVPSWGPVSPSPGPASGAGSPALPGGPPAVTWTPTTGAPATTTTTAGRAGVTTTIPAPRTAVGAAAREARPRAPEPRPGRTAAGTVSAQSMLAVLARLDDQRDGAFAAGDRALLDQVYAAGSAPLVADRARLAAMVAAGVHANGLALTVRRVDVVAVSATGVRLRVADELSSYALVRRDGSTVQRRPARPLTTWTIRLVRTGGGDDGWRIAAIARA